MPHFRLVIHINGILLMLLSLFMPIGALFSLYYADNDILPLFEAAGLTLLSGFLLWIFTGAFAVDFSQIRKRDAYVIVTVAWFLISLFGMAPYLFYDPEMSAVDAFFETVSGFTTTGASILNDIEALPHGILFWRSMTHWLGGMGIIVLTLAILPMLGLGGAQLFGAESGGIPSDKIHPQVQGTAKRLWGIYALLTFLETAFLYCGGMDLFDALCNSFATISTGGFSPKQDSIAAYPSAYIQYVIVAFMLLGGTNFSLLYKLMRKGYYKIWKDEEFRVYLLVVLAASLLTAWAVHAHSQQPWEPSFRNSLFQVVSIITSTGFVTANYETWAPFTPLLFLLLMFSGACVGSTSGAIKITRSLVLFKVAKREFKKLLHPRVVSSIDLNGSPLQETQVRNIISFFFLYITVFVVASFFMSLEPAFAKAALSSAMSSVATCLGGVGPGLGAVGPLENFSAISTPAKLFLSLIMVIGRLEIFTIFVLFSPSFWVA